jgi:hypothetical protein
MTMMVAQKGSEGNIIYKKSTADFWDAGSSAVSIEIKVRPAGLEPATPCLEGRFRRIIKIAESQDNIGHSYSSSWEWLVDACRKLLVFEALTIYKIIYSAVCTLGSFGVTLSLSLSLSSTMFACLAWYFSVKH